MFYALYDIAHSAMTHCKEDRNQMNVIFSSSTKNACNIILQKVHSCKTIKITRSRVKLTEIGKYRSRYVSRGDAPNNNF